MTDRWLLIADGGYEHLNGVLWVCMWYGWMVLPGLDYLVGLGMGRGGVLKLLDLFFNCVDTAIRGLKICAMDGWDDDNDNNEWMDGWVDGWRIGRIGQMDNYG